MFKGIDFFSDTVTRPTPEMRQAMVQAEVGDEQRGEDPTTLRLEERIAELLGKEAAMFLPSATMANEIALMELGRPGDELIAAENCHLFLAESGGPAVHARLQAKPIVTQTGMFTVADLKANFRTALGPLYPVSRVLSMENTTNMGGGIAWPLDRFFQVQEAAKELQMKVHLDGARLFNAATASEVPIKRLASVFDTVTICFSKGLGCPMGACLAFDYERWDSIRRFKQLMGGALRQSGMLAAAALYALDHHVQRLQDDHENARLLAKGLLDIQGIEVENPSPSTNMAYFKLKSKKYSPVEFQSTCEQRGLRFSPVGPDRFRAVTHLDISKSDVAKALGILKEICN